jgi:hypothetical protein
VQKEIGQELDVVKSGVRGRGAVRSALKRPDGSRCLSFRFWRDVRLVLAGLLAFSLRLCSVFAHCDEAERECISRAAVLTTETKLQWSSISVSTDQNLTQLVVAFCCS